MDVKSAFGNVSKRHLVGRRTDLGVEADLVRWTQSFVSNRKVHLVLNGQEGSDHEVETGIPHGSPVSPILFTAYLSGLFKHVEEQVQGVKALSFVDDVAWTTEGDSEDDIFQTLQLAAAAAWEWAEANPVAFDTEKTEAIHLSRRRKRQTPGTPPRGTQWQGAQSSSMRKRPGGSASGSTLS